MTEQDLSEFGRAHAAATVAALEPLLAPEQRALFGVPFVRSHLLYEEFVTRLTLGIAHAAGLAPALEAGGSAQAIAEQAGLELPRALVPLDWMLRRLAQGGLVAAGPDGYRAPAALPVADPAPVKAEQLRWEPSWAPAYVIAETAASEYPAFLRGKVAGEEILFSPRRLGLWVDYFSNAHGLYAINNHLGAQALAQWLPREGGVVVELGGGLGSGALAALEHLEATRGLAAVREYRFTEFVAAFLRRGQRALEARYPAPGRLAFGSLDMNRPFAEQGLAAGSATVVYGVNTLHVATDLDATLAEILRVLEPGGRLVVSECVRPRPGWPVYAELIFNLMETFRAPRLRPPYRTTGGFLTPAEWRAALEAAGFVDVRTLPDLAAVHARVPDFYAGAIGATRPA